MSETTPFGERDVLGHHDEVRVGAPRAASTLANLVRIDYFGLKVAPCAYMQDFGPRPTPPTRKRVLADRRQHREDWGIEPGERDVSMASRPAQGGSHASPRDHTRNTRRLDVVLPHTFSASRSRAAARQPGARQHGARAARSPANASGREDRSDTRDAACLLRRRRSDPADRLAGWHAPRTRHGISTSAPTRTSK
jgi:hypothetical protein